MNQGGVGGPEESPYANWPPSNGVEESEAESPVDGKSEVQEGADSGGRKVSSGGWVKAIPNKIQEWLKASPSKVDSWLRGTPSKIGNEGDVASKKVALLGQHRLVESENPNPDKDLAREMKASGHLYKLRSYTGTQRGVVRSLTRRLSGGKLANANVYKFTEDGREKFKINQNWPGVRGRSFDNLDSLEAAISEINERAARKKTS